MKKFFETASRACVLTGSVVGVGFLSGKEVSLFLSGDFVANAAVFAAVLSAILVIASEFARRKRACDLGETLAAALGEKVGEVASFVLSSCLFVVSATTLAGFNDCFCRLCFLPSDLPIFSFLCALICGAVLFFGIKGVALTSAAALPVVAFAVLLCFVFGDRSLPAQTTHFGHYGAVFYAIESATLTFGVAASTSANSSFRRNVVATTICGVTLFLAAVAVCSVTQNGEDFPIFAAAEQGGPFVVAITCVAVAFAALTTVCSSCLVISSHLDKIFDDKFLSISLTLFLSTLLSVFGFDNIAKWFYPSATVLGALLAVFAVFRSVLSKMRKRKTASF